MEWVDGFRLTDDVNMNLYNLNKSKMVDTLVQCSLKQILENGKCIHIYVYSTLVVLIFGFWRRTQKPTLTLYSSLSLSFFVSFTQQSQAFSMPIREYLYIT
jgi:hypothetical protein